MSPVDIFTLQKRDARSTSKLMEREGYGETSVRNLFGAIDARRTIELHRLIYGLGIRHVGEGNAKLLARHYGTIENFREAMLAAAKGAEDEENTTEAYQDLNNIGGVGEIVADAVVEFFAEPRNVKALGELLREIEVKPAEQPRKSSPVSGKTVVFTGSLTNSPATRPRRWPSVSAPRSPARCRRRPTTSSPARMPAPNSPRRASLASRC